MQNNAIFKKRFSFKRMQKNNQKKNTRTFFQVPVLKHILMVKKRWHKKIIKYRFPLLFAVDTFCHFGPQILNLQMKKSIYGLKLSFCTNFKM